MARANTARVLTFHVDASRIGDAGRAMDDAVEHLSGSPGFAGLLGLVDDGPRPQVVMISLWDAPDLKAAAGEDQAARRRIAEISETGVTSRVLSVLRSADPLSPSGDLRH